MIWMIFDRFRCWFVFFFMSLWGFEDHFLMLNICSFVCNGTFYLLGSVRAPHFRNGISHFLFLPLCVWCCFYLWVLDCFFLFLSVVVFSSALAKNRFLYVTVSVCFLAFAFQAAPYPYHIFLLTIYILKGTSIYSLNIKVFMFMSHAFARCSVDGRCFCYALPQNLLPRLLVIRCLRPASHNGRPPSSPG